MKILIVAATSTEVSRSFKSAIINEDDTGKIVNFRFGQLDLTLLITGPGMVPTAFLMGRVLAAEKFDLAIDLGIAGSFNEEISIGETVHIISDLLAEAGADSADGFIPLYSMKMARPYKPDFSGNDGLIMNTSYPKLASVTSLRTVSAVTVNTISGCEKQIEMMKARTQADVESMEGAAFFYACMMHQLPCLQVRTVSNYIAPRDKARWNIGNAVENLALHVNRILEELNQQAP